MNCQNHLTFYFSVALPVVSYVVLHQDCKKSQCESYKMAPLNWHLTEVLEVTTMFIEPKQSFIWFHENGQPIIILLKSLAPSLPFPVF